MPIVRLTNPDWLPVTLDAAKDHLLVDGVDAKRDARIETALRSAIEHVEMYSGRLLARATYALTLEDWPARRLIEVPAAPVISVDEVAYYDIDGATQIVADSNYVVEIRPDGALVVFNSEFSAPALYYERAGRVTVAFTAGYENPAESGSGDDPELSLPYTLRAAVLMKTEAIFEAGALGEKELEAIERAIADLIFSKKIIRG